MSGADPRAEDDQDRRSSLESRIKELGAEADSYKAGSAAAFGGAVFLLLIAAGAAYDIVTRKSPLWRAAGLSRGGLHWLAGVFAVAGAALLGIGIFRTRRRNPARDETLAKLEDELADLDEKQRT